MDWLNTITGNELIYHSVIAVVIVIVFYVMTSVVRGFLGFIGRKIIARTENELDDKILAVVLAHVRPLMIVIGLHVAVREIRKGVPGADLTMAQVLEYADGILYVVVVVLVIKILLAVIREFIHWYLDKVSGEGAGNLKMTIGPLTDKVMKIVIGLVAVIIVLDHFGINIGSLLVSLGVGSLAVALAAQETLANMIAGFVILIDRPFRVGDRIELTSGQVGDVQQIGLRSTKVLNFDHNFIMIPNSELVKTRIINYAYPFNQTRVVLKVGVAYGSDPEKVRGILMKLASNQLDILKDPPPEVFFTAMNDWSIEFTLNARVEDFTQRFKVETSLREQAYLAFNREGIEIPFPQRVVTMKANA